MFLFEGDWGGEEESEGEAGGMLRESVGAPSGRQRGLKEGAREASYERERKGEREKGRERRKGGKKLARTLLDLDLLFLPAVLSARRSKGSPPVSTSASFRAFAENEKVKKKNPKWKERKKKSFSSTQPQRPCPECRGLGRNLDAPAAASPAPLGQHLRDRPPPRLPANLGQVQT